MIIVRCLSCGRDQECALPSVQVCICGSRTFAWDDHIADARRGARAMRQQGRVVEKVA